MAPPSFTLEKESWLETADGKKTSKTAREKDTEREGVEGRESEGGGGNRVNRLVSIHERFERREFRST